MATIGSLWINVKSNTSGLSKGLGKARGMLGKFGKFAASPAGIAVAAFAALTAGVVLATKAISASLKEFMAFEAGMAEVKSILIGTDKITLQNLTDQAKQLGSTTAFTAAEATEGMANLARAGFNPLKDEIQNAITPTLNLAAAFGMDLAQSADIVAVAVRGFGLDASEAGHAADVLALAASKTNTTIDDLGQGIAYVAPVAKQLGFSMEETTALMGKLADAGIKGSAGGTALRKMMLSLGKEIEESGTEAFYDYLEAGHSVTENFDKFGARAVTAAGVLSLVTEETEALKNSMVDAQDVVQNMADTRLDTLAGDATLFQSALSGLQTELGEKLAPTFRAIVQVATKFIGGLQAAFSQVFGSVEGSIISTETLMTVFKVLGKIIIWVVVQVAKFYNRVAFVVNTIKALVLGLVSLVVFNVTNVVKAVAWGLDAIGVISTDTYDAIVNTSDALVEDLATSAVDAAKAAGDNFVMGFVGGAEVAGEKASGAFNDSMDGIKDHSKDAGKQVAEKLAEGLEEGTPAVVAAVEELTEVQMELISEGTKLNDKLQEQITYFGMSAAEILNAKTAEAGLTSATVEQTLALEKQLEALKAEQVAMDASKQAAEDAIALAKSKADAMQSAADKIIESLRTPQEVYDAEEDKLRKLMDANLLTLEQFEGAVNKLDKKGLEVTTKKKEEIEIHIESKGFVEGLSTAMGSIKVAGQVNKAEQIAEKSVDIQTKIQSVMDAVKSNTEQNLEAVESVQQETAAVASTLSTDVNGVENMLDTIDTSINNIANSSQMDATEQLLGTSNELSNNQLTQLQNINQNLLAMNSGGSLT